MREAEMIPPLFDLTGRVAVVSGASSGVGRAMSLALGQFGADLALLDLNHDGLAATAEAIRELGRRAIPLPCDVADPEQIRSTYATLDREFGRVDFLGNVAGEGILGRPE